MFVAVKYGRVGASDRLRPWYARVVLRRTEIQAVIRYLECPPNGHPAAGEVDVSPLEPQQLALPETRVYGHDVEGFIAGIPRPR